MTEAAPHQKKGPTAEDAPWKGKCSSRCYSATSDKKRCKCRCHGKLHGGETLEPLKRKEIWEFFEP